MQGQTRAEELEDIEVYAVNNFRNTLLASAQPECELARRASDMFLPRDPMGVLQD